MRLAKAHWAIVTMDTLVNVMGCPTRNILKESNAADATVIAQIEPVLHPARYIDHIPAFDRHTKYRAVVRVKVKHPLTLDSEAYLVLGVRVLLVEFRQHRVKVRCRWVHVDDVSRHEATGLFNLLNLRRILGQNVRVAGSRIQPPSNLPMLVPNPKRLEKRRDLFCLGDGPVFSRDIDCGHDRMG